MTKKHFIALADQLIAMKAEPFYDKEQLAAFTRDMARFCKAQNPRFDTERFLGYVAGTCGPNGGAR